jgi:gliding motility-associated-like protein
MKIQLYSILLLVLGLQTSAHAQVLLSPFGASMTDGKNSHCYSGGEVVITTINNSDEVVTQGFQQPNDIEEQLVLDIVNGLISDDPDNNKFVITNISEYPDNRVVVLNRWGDIVFEAAPYNNDWDGTYNGNPLPAATYYYIIYLDDSKTKPVQGNLYILNP